MHGQVPLGEAIAFWILGADRRWPARIGMVLLRNAVHSALSLVATMICLGAFYMIEQGAVPRAGADHRLHRRDHDPVPVRAHAGRPRFLRLDRRDAARAAAGPRRCSGSASRCSSRSSVGRAFKDTTPVEPRRGPNADGGNVNSHRRAALHQVPVRVRAHLGAADRRRGRRDGAGPRRARRAASRPRSRSARARDPLRPPAAAARPRRARRRQRDRHAGAAARRLGRRAESVHGLDARVRASRPTSCRPSSTAPEERSMTPTYYLVLVGGAVHASARSACWCGATRSSCSCASS